jgi:hypothetical protein
MRIWSTNRARENDPMFWPAETVISATGTFSVLLTPVCATVRSLGADTLDTLLERGLSFDRAGTKTIPLVLSMLTPDGVHIGGSQLRD